MKLICRKVELKAININVTALFFWGTVLTLTHFQITVLKFKESKMNKIIFFLFFLCISSLLTINSYADSFEINKITENETNDRDPSLFDGSIAWMGSNEIYYWNGNAIIKITDDDDGNNGHPSLYNGSIAYMGYDGNDYEIYYWDGNTTINVSNNNSNDGIPSLHNGAIAWQGHDHQIYYWDGSVVTQVTQDNTDKSHPSLYNGTIAWAVNNANDHEINYWE